MQRQVISRSMKRAAILFVLGLLLASALPAQNAGEERQRRGLLGRLWPFGGSDLPSYKDPRLRGLVLELTLPEQPVRLSEVRQLEVHARLTNKSKRPITLEFPTGQRIEIQLLNSTGTVLTTWSDNRAFSEQRTSILVNPQEHLDYNETIATRDLSPNKVFIAEVFFPAYPELRVRQKFLTAP